MSRKHIDTGNLPPMPVATQTLVTGQLNIPLGGRRPELQLVRLSSGDYAVQFHAHGAFHGKIFDSVEKARLYFSQLTGETPVGRRVVP